MELQAFHADHDLVHRIVKHPAIQFVSFTGSVSGGRAVYQSVAASRFIDVGLELGGKVTHPHTQRNDDMQPVSDRGPTRPTHDFAIVVFA